MLRNKRGAIELSITTIIIIVIGVALLVLGLTFVSKIFKRGADLIDQSFARADAEIGIFESINAPLTLIPDTVKVKKGGSKLVTVIAANLDEGVAKNVKMSVKSSKSSIGCYFLSTENSVSSPRNIESGNQLKDKIVVRSLGDLATGACHVEVQGLSTSDNQVDLFVQVGLEE